MLFIILLIISTTFAHEKYAFYKTRGALHHCVQDHLSLPLDQNSTRVIAATAASRFFYDEGKLYTSEKIRGVLYFLLRDLNERTELFDEDVDLSELVEALREALIGCAEVTKEEIDEYPEDTYGFSKGKRALFQCLKDQTVQPSRYRKSRRRIGTLMSIVEATAKRFSRKKNDKYTLGELRSGITNLFRAKFDKDVPEIIGKKVQKTMLNALIDCSDEKSNPSLEGIMW